MGYGLRALYDLVELSYLPVSWILIQFLRLCWKKQQDFWQWHIMMHHSGLTHHQFRYPLMLKKEQKKCSYLTDQINIP